MRAYDCCIDPGSKTGKTGKEGPENGIQSKIGEQYVVIEMTNGKSDTGLNGKAEGLQGYILERTEYNSS